MGTLATANVTDGYGRLNLRKTGQCTTASSFCQIGNKAYGMVACDNGSADAAWLEGATESVKQLQSKYGTHRAVFIVRSMTGMAPQFLPGTQVRLIVSANQIATKEEVLTALRR